MKIEEEYSFSDSSSSLPWIAVLIAVLALILCTLCICCCCLHCCPQLCVFISHFLIDWSKSFSRCLCCPCKRRKKRPPSEESSQGDNSVQSSIPPQIVYNPFENSESLDDDIFSSTRPTSTASSRTADDIQLTGLTSSRTEKPRPHYTLALQRSPRVSPAPI
jgi:hypothetical protein